MGKVVSDVIDADCLLVGDKVPVVALLFKKLVAIIHSQSIIICLIILVILFGLIGLINLISLIGLIGLIGYPSPKTSSPSCCQTASAPHGWIG